MIGRLIKGLAPAEDETDNLQVIFGPITEPLSVDQAMMQMDYICTSGPDTLMYLFFENAPPVRAEVFGGDRLEVEISYELVGNYPTPISHFMSVPVSEVDRLCLINPQAGHEIPDNTTRWEPEVDRLDGWGELIKERLAAVKLSRQTVWKDLNITGATPSPPCKEDAKETPGPNIAELAQEASRELGEVNKADSAAVAVESCPAAVEAVVEAVVEALYCTRRAITFYIDKKNELQHLLANLDIESDRLCTQRDQLYEAIAVLCPGGDIDDLVETLHAPKNEIKAK